LGNPALRTGQQWRFLHLHPRLATSTINATVADPPQPPLDPATLPPHLRTALEEILLIANAQSRLEAGYPPSAAAKLRVQPHSAVTAAVLARIEKKFRDYLRGNELGHLVWNSYKATVAGCAKAWRS
jgi:hypothetical protein